MIERDEQLHLAFGAAAALAMLGVLAVQQHFGPRWAVMAAVAGLAIGYELVQKLRAEGQPSWADALAGIAGGAGLLAAAVAIGVV